MERLLKINCKSGIVILPETFKPSVFGVKANEEHKKKKYIDRIEYQQEEENKISFNKQQETI